MSAHRPGSFFQTRRAALLTAGLAVLALASCERSPLTAPSGTTITLVAETNVLPVNGSVDIKAVLIEGSQSGSGSTSTTTAGGGTTVHNGTLVTFTTTLGRLQPADASTNNGQATTRLIADGRSGTATITAFSGAATKTLDIQIGAAGATRIVVTANPQSLPGNGGTTSVSARVEDQEGNGLLGVPVSFSTTKGTLLSTSALTNDSGVATTSLTTTQEATVTASAGGASASLTGTVLVTLKPRTTVSITAPPSAIAAVPATFTITPGASAVITNVVVDFGDGSGSVPLGAITSATTLAHPFRSSGVFTVQATATDSEGGTGVASTQVAVAPLAVTVVVSPISPRFAAVVTFTATPSTGAIIDHYEWNFGDGSAGTTTSGQATHSFLSPGSYIVSVRVVPAGNGTAVTQLVTVDVSS